MDTHERRKQLRLLYGDLFDGVAAALYAADPIGINFGDNADEYHPEVSTLLPKLRECHSAADVQALLHREFVAWFDEHTAGPEGRYRQPAQAIWELWQRHLGHRSLAEPGAAADGGA